MTRFLVELQGIVPIYGMQYHIELQLNDLA